MAVGTLDPEIEIWSLDVVDGLYPDAILGPPPSETQPISSIRDSAPTSYSTASSSSSKKKKKPKTAKKPKVIANPEYHVDSILSLSWNRAHRNLLASSSADKTIKLWDLSLPTSAPALRSFSELHADKIQAIEWNPKEPTVLLSGSWDGTVRVFDSRAPDGGVGTKVQSDVECLKWNPWEPAGFLVSMENGLVQAYDSRMLSSAKATVASKPLWTLSAHDASVSSLDINTKIKGCIVTGGTDNLVKIWNVEEQDGEKRHISLVASRDLGVVRVHFSLLIHPSFYLFPLRSPLSPFPLSPGIASSFIFIFVDIEPDRSPSHHSLAFPRHNRGKSSQPSSVPTTQRPWPLQDQRRICRFGTPSRMLEYDRCLEID